jgi:hypothetical protein
MKRGLPPRRPLQFNAFAFGLFWLFLWSFFKKKSPQLQQKATQQKRFISACVLAPAMAGLFYLRIFPISPWLRHFGILFVPSSYFNA